MAEVPGVGAIVEQIKARIAQIEQQLRQHGDLSDELERLRDEKAESVLHALLRGVGQYATDQTQNDAIALLAGHPSENVVISALEDEAPFQTVRRFVEYGERVAYDQRDAV